MVISDMPTPTNYACGASLSNLNATITPAGFTSPVVPRNASGATPFNAPLTATLDGGAPSTCINWAVENKGPNPMPGWTARIYVDTESFVASSTAPNPNNPRSWQAPIVGKLFIRGGRHSLTQRADPLGLVAESNELDNQWTGQWVWSPIPLTI